MKEKLKKYLKQILISKYKINENEVDSIIETSAVNRATLTNQDYIMHYDIEDWASMVYEEHISLV